MTPAIAMLLWCAARGAGANEPLPADNVDLRRSAVVRAVEKAGPAVVNIYTEEMVKHLESSGDFFRDVFEPRYKRSLETTSLGSGILISPEGYVLTNFHVVSRGAKTKVALVDRREFEAKVVGTDPDLDLAVLKVTADGTLPFVPMGDSADLLVGETVVAIGNPFGLSNTVTTGVVSAVHRNLNADGRTFIDFVQTDASINPGNSGGALLNINGALIGINTAIYGNAQGIGFAIPVNRARRIVENLIQFGKVNPAYLGVDLGLVKGDEVKALKLNQETAVKVIGVEKGGPAEKGGLLLGDVVVNVEGFPIITPDDYSAKLRDFTAGSQVRMSVLRQGKAVDVNVVAGPVPPELADRVVQAQIGIKVADLTQALRERYSVKGAGVVITQVLGGTPAAQARLRDGDLVLKVNSVDVQSLDDFRQAVLRARRSGEVVFLIKRGNQLDQVGFKL